MSAQNTLYILGLTGSIGSGKSETARMLKRMGFPVSESDAIVKNLYETGALEKSLAALFPKATRPFTASTVSALMMKNPALLDALESVIHPLVRKAHHHHIELARQAREALIVLDIPLLFETGWSQECDGILVVFCDPETQRERVLGRPGMMEEKFAFFQERQWSQEKKCAQANFVLDTSKGRLHTYKALRQLLESHCVRGRKGENDA